MSHVLIHIGYHKTATSWLQRAYFSEPRSGLQTLGKQQGDHPVRKLIRARPLEFDAQASRAEFEPMLQAVREQGLVPVVALERLSGHACSGGYDSKELADRLAAVFPEGKVLVVIREQVRMIVSTYKQYIRGGGAGTLREFLQPASSRNLRVPTFDFRHFEYDHLLRHYQALFGAENVLALAFEQFTSAPADFVSEIGRFAGRPVSDELLGSLPFEFHKNPAISTTRLGFMRRRNHLLHSELNPTPLFQTPFRKSLRRIGNRPWLEAVVP
ncbi:MAG: sulfotransferase, partial [Actinomycetota bacterium]